MKKIKVMVIVTLIIGAIVYPVINDEKINASSSDGWHEMVGGITIGPGTPGIYIEPKDNLYYGEYYETGDINLPKQPLKWNVMESKGNALYVSLGTGVGSYSEDLGKNYKLSSVPSYVYKNDENAWYKVDGLYFKYEGENELNSTILDINTKHDYFKVYAQNGWNTSFIRAWLNGLSISDMEKHGYFNINIDIPMRWSMTTRKLTEDEINDAKAAPMDTSRKAAFDQDRQFYSNAFSSEEKEGILVTERAPSEKFLGDGFLNVSDPTLENIVQPFIQPRVKTKDKIFMMSIDELKRFRNAGVSGNQIRYNGTSVDFQLEDIAQIAGLTGTNQGDYFGFHGSNFAASRRWNSQEPGFGNSGVIYRPSMNIDQDMIYYKSYAKDGKTTTEGDITVYNEYNKGGDFKLTLKDHQTNVTLTEKESKKVYQNQGLQLSYTDASLGENQYLSCMFIDSTDGFKYYGRIKATQDEIDKEGVLQVPTKNVAPGKYTVHVYSETYNGDFKTDYASRPQIMEVEVLAGDPITADTNQPSLVENTIATLNGKVTGEGIGEKGFEIKEGNGSWEKVDTSLINEDGELMSAKLDNLKPSTEYTYRTYASKNGTDIIYGAGLSFTTKRAPILTKEDDNVILGVENTYWEDETVSFEAIGSNYDNIDPVLNDERFIPFSYIVDNKEIPFQTSRNKNENQFIGSYMADKGKLSVKFEKQVYDTKEWKSQKEYVIKNIDFSILYRASIITGKPSHISFDKATLHGTLKKNNETISELGFEYKKSTDQDYQKIVVDTEDELFQTTLSNLEENQNYEYRTYVKTTETENIIYGKSESFMSGQKNIVTPIVPSLPDKNPGKDSSDIPSKGPSDIIIKEPTNTVLTSDQNQILGLIGTLSISLIGLVTLVVRNKKQVK